MHGPHQVAQTFTTRILPETIGAQLAQRRGVGRRERHRLAVDLFAPAAVARGLLRPLDRAAEDHGVRDRRLAAGQQGVQRVAGVVVRRERLALGVIDAALETQPARRVEDEHMRRGHRPVLPRDGLGRSVIEEGIVELPVGRAQLHGLERVVEVGVALLVEADASGLFGLMATKATPRGR